MTRMNSTVCSIEIVCIFRISGRLSFEALGWWLLSGGACPLLASLGRKWAIVTYLALLTAAVAGEVVTIFVRETMLVRAVLCCFGTMFILAGCVTASAFLAMTAA